VIILSFNKNLKILLNKQNFKQADLCRLTGIQTSLMSEYVKGKKSPTIKNAMAIANAFHISLDTLVGNELISDIPLFITELTQSNFDSDIKQLIRKYSLLNDDDKELVNKMIDSLLKKLTNN